jgi:hypothetical protein
MGSFRQEMLPIFVSGVFHLLAVMKNMLFIQLIATLAFSFSGHFASAQKKKSSPPNIIFILADDLGMHALSGPYAERATQALQAGCDAVIGALSIVKQGMAGTVWDKENFHNLAQTTLPPMAPTPAAYVQALTLLGAPSMPEVAEKQARFRALWATRPRGIDAMVTV